MGKENYTIEQTYIFAGLNGKNYFVSTINRESSTTPPMWYAESIAFEWDIETKETGGIVDQEEAGMNSHIGHDKLVQRMRG